MTDAEIRTSISTILDLKLAAGSREVMNLYGELAVSRGKNCADHFLTICQLASRGGSPDELGDAITVLIQSHPANTEPPIVISLHGIFTTGAWQKRLAPIVARAHMVPEPFDYGFFLPIWFLSGWVRARKVERFLQDYTEVRRLHREAAISICAHSFGTYILGYAMLKYEHVRFDQIILCGSILPENFPWDQFISAGRVRRVLNEYGGKDSWARRAKRWVPDAGPSGYKGFAVNCPGFFQRHYARYKHSDFFHPLQFEQNWLPFLAGAEPKPPTVKYSPPVNKSIYYTLAVILAVIIVAILVIWWWCGR